MTEDRIRLQESWKSRLGEVLSSEKMLRLREFLLAENGQARGASAGARYPAPMRNPRCNACRHPR